MRVIASQRLRTLGASVKVARERVTMRTVSSRTSLKRKARPKMRKGVMRRNQAKPKKKATKKVRASPPVNLPVKPEAMKIVMTQ